MAAMILMMMRERKDNERVASRVVLSSLGYRRLVLGLKFVIMSQQQKAL
jgi:hypothetical protein